MKVITKQESAVCVCEVKIKVTTDDVTREFVQSVGYTDRKFDPRVRNEVKTLIVKKYKELIFINPELREKLCVSDSSKIRVYSSFKVIPCNEIIKLKNNE